MILIDINLLNIVNIFSEQINIILNLLINLIIIESFIALIIYFKNGFRIYDSFLQKNFFGIVFGGHSIGRG